MAVEYDGEDPNDPSANALVHFGFEVLEERKRRGVSQSQLAAAVPCDKSLVQRIEKAKRIPSREFAEACDRVFDGNGRFLRHWKWAIKYAFPVWFGGIIELEEQAAAIRLFQSLLVPGLLQMRGVCRAVLRTGRLTDLEDLVTARMARQHILTRDSPPRLWVVLDAGVLTRTVGDAEVMREQLVRLRSWRSLLRTWCRCSLTRTSITAGVRHSPCFPSTRGRTSSILTPSLAAIFLPSLTTWLPWCTLMI